MRTERFMDRKMGSGRQMGGRKILINAAEKGRKMRRQKNLSTDFASAAGRDLLLKRSVK